MVAGWGGEGVKEGQGRGRWRKKEGYKETKARKV